MTIGSVLKTIEEPIETNAQGVGVAEVAPFILATYLVDIALIVHIWT